MKKLTDSPALTSRTAPGPRLRRVRSDSKLKNLPQPDQEQIIAWLAASSYRDVVKLVRQNLAVSTSVTALGAFRSWWLVGRHLRNLPALAQSVASSPLATLDASPDQLAEAIQIIFQLNALQQHDVNGFCRMRRLQQTDLRFKMQQAAFNASHPNVSPILLTPEQEENLTRANLGLPLLPNVPPPPLP